MSEKITEKKSEFPTSEKAFCGSIELIIGPMFSGKTTELFRRCNRHEFSNRSVLVIKYAKDSRYSMLNAATHDNRQFTAVGLLKLEGLFEEDKVDLKGFDVIGVDEGQFFPDLHLCEKLANMGKKVIIAALDGTFLRDPFKARAEQVTKLSAICVGCFSDAYYSKRITNEKEVQVIGGAESYVAVCRTCYFNKDVNTLRPFKKKSSIN